MALPRGALQQLKKLDAVSGGKGAFLLPATVRALELRLDRRVPEGSIGAKRLWKQDLPTVQFYNPHVPIRVTRFEAGPATRAEVLVSFVDGRKQSVLAEGQQSGAILAALVQECGATPVPPSDIVKLAPVS